MSEMKEAKPVLRLCSCLTGNRLLVEEVRVILEKEYGSVHLVSEPFPFDFTDYYQEETGRNIRRYWLVFRQLMAPDSLVAFRHKTEKVEDSFKVDNKRKINLDPGYLDFGKLVLASFKEGGDKIYLGKCVWAHTCLRYCKGTFTAPVHSFPDFKEGIFTCLFLQLRKLYREWLRSTALIDVQ